MRLMCSSSYESGQLDAIEMMIGFMGWREKNYTRLYGDTNDNAKRWFLNAESDKFISEIEFFTTIELLTKYIKEVL